MLLKRAFKGIPGQTQSQRTHLKCYVQERPELVNPGFCEVSVNYKNITKICKILDFGKVRTNYKKTYKIITSVKMDLGQSTRNYNIITNL